MLTKYADAEIVDFQITDPQSLRKTASFEHIPEDRFRTKDGYIYVKVRAISSRVNKNHDGWPVNELAGMKESAFRDLQKELDLEDSDTNKSSATKIGRVFTSSNKRSSNEYGYKTFIGRPIFVDHNNSDPRRARGVVVDSILHIEPSGKRYSANDYWSSAPDNHKPETHIELLLEVDAQSFPKLARAIKEGKVNAVSMGANVTHTICNICQKEAKTVDDYCDHIKRKGIKYTRADGTKTSAYEDCYNPNFFEISFVFDPADATALTTGPVITSSVKESSNMKRLWEEQEPEGDENPELSEDTDIDKLMEMHPAKKKTASLFDILVINQEIRKVAADYGYGYPDYTDTSSEKRIEQNAGEGVTGQGVHFSPEELAAHAKHRQIDPIANQIFRTLMDSFGWPSEDIGVNRNQLQRSIYDSLMAGAPPEQVLAQAQAALGTSLQQRTSSVSGEQNFGPADDSMSFELYGKGKMYINHLWEHMKDLNIDNLEEAKERLHGMAQGDVGTYAMFLKDLAKIAEELEFDKREEDPECSMQMQDFHKRAVDEMVSLQYSKTSSVSFNVNDINQAIRVVSGFVKEAPAKSKKQYQFMKAVEHGMEPRDSDISSEQAKEFTEGQSHEDYEKLPEKKKKKESKSCNCWDGYKRVPGTEPCAPGSCEKCDSHRAKTSSVGNWNLYEKSISKLADRGENLTHDRYDTLREEAHCPFDIRHCGMDEKSGHCDVCGFSSPPAGLGEPNIEKAKKNLHRIEDAVHNLDEGEELNFRLDDIDEMNEGVKDIEDLISEIGKIRKHHSKTLTNEQSRNFNLQTTHGKSGVMNQKSQIVLTASVETAPTDQELLSKGWDVVAATPKTPIAEDGQRATNEPQSTRVVSDQLAPVTSSFYRESTLDSSYPTPNTGAEGGNGADGTPQFRGPGGNINEDGGMNEHHPTTTIGTGSNHPVPDTGPDGGHVSAPQYAGGMQNSKSDPQSTGLTEHHPTAVVPASYPVPGTGPEGGNGAIGTPQFHGEDAGGNINDKGGLSEHHPGDNGVDGSIPQTGPKGKGHNMGGKTSSESHLLNAMKLAKLEIELGLITEGDEFNRVASLEKAEARDILVRRQALTEARAGVEQIAKKASADRKTSMTLPSMKQVEATASAEESTITPDEAIFG